MAADAACDSICRELAEKLRWDLVLSGHDVLLGITLRSTAEKVGGSLNCEKPGAERRSDGFEGEVQSTIKRCLVNYENFCNRLGSTFSTGNVTKSSFGTFLPFSYTNNSEFLHPLSRTF